MLKNISQWEGLSHILWKIKYVPNHQPVKWSPKCVFIIYTFFFLIAGWENSISVASNPEELVRSAHQQSSTCNQQQIKLQDLQVAIGYPLVN